MDLRFWTFSAVTGCLIILQSVLRQVHSLCQSQFFTQCGIVLLLPKSRILSFPEGRPVAAYIIFLVFPPLLSFLIFFPYITCFRGQFLHKMWPIQWTVLIFIVRVCRMYRCSLIDCHTSSFLTQSVQLIFSILLQHHISQLARYFWCTLHSVQFQHHTKLCSKCSTLLVSSLNCSPVCWWKEPTCWKLLLPCQSWT